MDSIDWNQVGIGLGNGLATSFIVLGAVNFIGIPVSYVANRFIYHSKGMRFLLSLVATVLSIPLLFGMLIYQFFSWVTGGSGLQEAHYFGYLPFIIKSKTDDEEKAEIAKMSWIDSLTIPLWNNIRDVLFAGFVDHREEEADKTAFETAGGAILVPIEQKGDRTKVILEEVMRLAQRAAQAATKDDSEDYEKDALKVLSGGSSAPPALPAPALPAPALPASALPASALPASALPASAPTQLADLIKNVSRRWAERVGGN